MGFFTVFIRHPILAIMLNLALVAAGLFAFTRLNVDDMPAINIAMVTITTKLEGATPEQVEGQLTIPIENAVATVNGLDELSSTTTTGESKVTVKMQLGVLADVALADCRDKVDAIVNDFPQGTQRPVYAKLSASEQALVKIALTGPLSVRDMTELAHFDIVPALQTVNGVGDVQLFGGRRRVVQIHLDQEKLLEHDVTVTQIKNAVTGHNAQVPGGRVTSATNDYLLQLDSDLRNVSDFAQIAVVDPVDTPQRNSTSPANTSSYYNQPVTLGMLGEVLDGEEEVQSLSRLNGTPTITLAVSKTATANELDVVKRVRDKVDDLNAQAEAGVKLTIVQDNSYFIQQSVDDLQEDLYLGAALASATVLVFLLNLRLTLIAALAIPVSLIGTLVVMLALNYTLNYMTLLALSLATGIVIDDAVVVLENISRFMDEKGMTPQEAAIEGLQDISFAVLATTLSLVVLFLPLAFMPGVVGLYFRSWGITMATAIALSMWVSFTLTPTLCALLLKPRQGPPRGPGLLTRVLQSAYVRLLSVALTLRYPLMLFAGLLVLWAGHLFGVVGKEFQPNEDQGFYDVKLTMPPGWPFERTSEQLRYVEADLRKLPQVETVLLTSSRAGEADIYVKLTPYAKRAPYDQYQAEGDARRMLARYSVLKPALLWAGQDKTFEYTVLGPKVSVLSEIGKKLEEGLAQVPGVVDLGSTLEPGAPEVRLALDPARAADLEVDPQDAFETLGTLIGGSKIASWQVGSRSYDVRLRLLPDQRSQPDDVRRIYVPSRKQNVSQVPISSVARLTTSQGATGIDRYQRQRKVAVQANLLNGTSLSDANAKADEILQAMHPPPGYGPVATANSKQMQETAVAALQSFILSVLFMYMVMASQFENLLDPFVILLTLPLAVPFALLSLVLTGMTLNLFSVLGMFLLFGVVKKNAILQIDATNHRLRQGMPVREAILEANRDRLRPILMTTLTLVLAMLPVAFAPPTGALRAPMAMVVVGGQSMCLLLTLLVVPAATYVIEDIKRLLSWRPWRKSA